MNRLNPKPAVALSLPSRSRKATSVRKSAMRSKSAVQRASSVMPASGGFKEGDYPKREQELHQDQEGAAVGHEVEQHRRNARGQRERVDGQHRSAPGHS